MQTTKRFACTLCRRRKLKCDGERPICMTCKRLGHPCGYDQTESRTRPASRSRRPQSASTTTPRSRSPIDGQLPSASAGLLLPLGLREPLPDQVLVDELNTFFFDNVNPFLPILHKARYLLACQAAPNVGVPACLRYAVWAMAASWSSKHKALEDLLYQRARSYAESDELKGAGLSVMTVEHVQCWSLLAQYESQKMAFARAWMSLGRGTRLALMLGLHQLDKEKQSSKRMIRPPKDWIELEIRRRAFWLAFINEKWASVGLEWPTAIDIQEISTNLPSSQHAFMTGQPEVSSTFRMARDGQCAPHMSLFAVNVLIADLTARIRDHLHFDDADGLFSVTEQQDLYKRHVDLDNSISSLFLSLHDDHKIPAALLDPVAVSVSMNIHSLVISLHRAMIMMLESSDPTSILLARSEQRCDLAAEEIINTLRLISHLDLSKSGPYLPFALSVAASVLIPKVKKYGTACEAYKSLQLIRLAIKSQLTAHAFNAAFLARLDLAMDPSVLPVSVIDLDDVDSVPVSVPGLAMRPKTSSKQFSAGTVGADQMVSVNQAHSTETLPIFLEGVLPERMPVQSFLSTGDKLEQVYKTTIPSILHDDAFEQDMQGINMAAWGPNDATDAISNNDILGNLEHLSNSDIDNLDFETLLNKSQLDFFATGESDYIT